MADIRCNKVKTISCLVMAMLASGVLFSGTGVAEDARTHPSTFTATNAGSQGTSNRCAQVREDPRDAGKTYDIRRSSMDVHHGKIWLKVNTYSPIKPSDLGPVPRVTSRDDGHGAHKYTFEAGLVTQRTYGVRLHQSGSQLTAVAIDYDTIAEGGPLPHKWPEFEVSMLDSRTVAFHLPLQLVHHPIRDKGHKSPKEKADAYDTIAWSFSIRKEIQFDGYEPCWECFESAPDTAANEAGAIGAVGYLYPLDLYELDRDQPLRTVGSDNYSLQPGEQQSVVDLTELLLGRDGGRLHIRMILYYPSSKPEVIPRTLPPHTSIRWRFKVGQQGFVVDAAAESAQAPEPVFTLWAIRKSGLRNLGQIEGYFDKAEGNWAVDLLAPISKIAQGKWRGSVVSRLSSSNEWDAASFARLSPDIEQQLDGMKITEEFVLC